MTYQKVKTVWFISWVWKIWDALATAIETCHIVADKFVSHTRDFVLKVLNWHDLMFCLNWNPTKGWFVTLNLMPVLKSLPCMLQSLAEPEILYRAWNMYDFWEYQVYFVILHLKFYLDRSFCRSFKILHSFFTVLSKSSGFPPKKTSQATSYAPWPPILRI